ncbi:hypothetical protein M427DRAFT_129927 [Gonapodya prolifera JEL478]|uniref:histidine kinase n=1 Tax=Gonapodya prolifera (strain JEL478) TaxID=1344416 RepID=A0A139AZL0_GONPJ|nr:hypothetical protein M427DRAFT_129927 [Gonapodya prolifera JEL478]|eukprot:KXS22176.1 hypothetical protein M427DRAFT_129927 [Gonapodya prolifera JEL478]
MSNTQDSGRPNLLRRINTSPPHQYAGRRACPGSPASLRSAPPHEQRNPYPASRVVTFVNPVQRYSRLHERRSFDRPDAAPGSGGEGNRSPTEFERLMKELQSEREQRRKAEERARWMEAFCDQTPAFLRCVMDVVENPDGTNDAIIVWASNRMIQYRYGGRDPAGLSLKKELQQSWHSVASYFVGKCLEAAASPNSTLEFDIEVPVTEVDDHPPRSPSECSAASDATVESAGFGTLEYSRATGDNYPVSASFTTLTALGAEGKSGGVYPGSSTITRVKRMRELVTFVETTPTGAKRIAVSAIDPHEEPLLQLVESRYKRIMDLVPAFVVVCDVEADSKPIIWNANSYVRDQLLGMDPGHLLLQHSKYNPTFFSIVHPDDREHAKKAFSLDVLKLQGGTGDSVSFRVTKPSKDPNPTEVDAGNVVHVKARSALMNEQGQEFLVLVITDAELEYQLHLKNSDLQDALSSKELFIANVSHELRTPLHGLKGMTRLLQETSLRSNSEGVQASSPSDSDVSSASSVLPFRRANSPLSPVSSTFSKEQEEYLHMIRTCTDDLTRVIDDLLDFSKLQAGKTQLDAACFNVRDLLNSVTSLLSSTATERGIFLVSQVAENVPKIAKADPGRIRQVLLNLVGNAIKFSGSGTTVSIALRMDPTHQDARITSAFKMLFEIKDHGIGIPVSRFDRLFKPFSQVDSSTSRNYGGTGLGLSISRGLVELLGGRIWVDSEEGIGSTFSFTVAFARPTPDEDLKWLEEHGESGPDLGLTLPISRDTENIVGSVAPMVAPSTAPNVFEGVIKSARDDSVNPTTRTRRTKLPIRPLPKTRNPDLQLLLAEDNLVNQTLVARLLEKSGFRNVEMCLNGAEAVKTVSERGKNGIPIDLILMFFGIDAGGGDVDTFVDIQMPLMSGYEATKLIRKMDLTVQPWILALTANAQNGDKKRSIEHGMDGHLSKPLELVDLVSAIDAFGEHRRRTCE